MAERRTAILNTDGGSLQTSYYPLLKTKLKNYIALLKFCHVLSKNTVVKSGLLI